MFTRNCKNHDVILRIQIEQITNLTMVSLEEFHPSSPNLMEKKKNTRKKSTTFKASDYDEFRYIRCYLLPPHERTNVSALLPSLPLGESKKKVLHIECRLNSSASRVLPSGRAYKNK